MGLHNLMDLHNVLSCALKMVKIVNVTLWVFHTKNEGVAHLPMPLSEVPVPYLLPPPLACPGDSLFPAFGKVKLWLWAALGLHILHLAPHVLSLSPALGRGGCLHALCAARAAHLHQGEQRGSLASGKTAKDE